MPEQLLLPAPKPKKTKEEMLLEIYGLLKQNPLVWFHFYFAHHVRLETPPFHVELIRQTLANRFLAVAAPRESAKSTILVFVKPFHDIVFKKKRFILILSNTFKKAAMSLDSIKKELVENQKLVDSFPGIKITKDAEGDAEIRHPDGFTTKILCRGVDQIGSVRGVKFGAYRPDLIIGDDMEDDELVKNPMRRGELQQLFDEALVPAGEKGLCQFIVVGTVLHDDCLLSKLVSKDYYPEWYKLFYKARRDNHTSLWPEKWTVEYLDQMEKDKPTVFAKEMQNDPVAGRNARFRREDFRYYRIENKEYVLLSEFGEVVARGRLSDCVPAIACDLAWKEKRESDACVIMPGYLTPGAEILIEDYITEKGLKPDQIANHLFLMEERMRNITGQIVPIGFEKAMLENVTQWFLKQEMRRRNKYLMTKELIWDTDKITRIETRLVPRYSQHVIYHKKGMGNLEHQLERHPYGTHDDLVDAEQGLVQLLQYPRKAEKSLGPDDEFMRVRKIMLDAKDTKKKHAYPRRTSAWYSVPAVRSFR